jgi:hypothetical protein
LVITPPILLITMPDLGDHDAPIFVITMGRRAH